MTPLITVIIPAYNVAPYIRKCLDSVIHQTYKNLEIILIDDGSTDESGAICDEYSKQDKRIKVIHKMNGGQSSARNTGLDIATGDYIAFVDSDDWLELDMYKGLSKVLNDNPTIDIVTCGITEEYDNKRIKTAKNTNEISVLDQRTSFLNLFNSQKNIRFEVWNKLFRKTVIGKARFVEDQVYEEVHFNFEVLRSSNKIAVKDTCYYCYRMQRPGNTNSSFKWNRFSIFPELYRYVLWFRMKHWDDLADKYAKYAAETALSLYVNAGKAKTDSQLVKECKYWAHFYINLCKYKSLKLIIFSISPGSYKYISGLRAKHKIF